MKKHESYYAYYPKTGFRVYLSKGLFWVVLDILGASFIALAIWAFFFFLSILQAGV